MAPAAVAGRTSPTVSPAASAFGLIEEGGMWRGSSDPRTCAAITESVARRAKSRRFHMPRILRQFQNHVGRVLQPAPRLRNLCTSSTDRHPERRVEGPGRVEGTIIAPPA